MADHCFVESKIFRSKKISKKIYQQKISAHLLEIFKQFRYDFFCFSMLSVTCSSNISFHE